MAKEKKPNTSKVINLARTITPPSSNLKANTITPKPPKKK
jgi:hypothetical protein